MQPREFTFDGQLAFSQGASENASVETVLLANIPGAAKAYRAHSSNDRNGTDWWVETESGNHLSVDCKVRKKDYAATFPPKDDLALETLSVVEKQVIGWTRNSKKRSDFILWLWKDTGRWCLISFPMLCKVFILNWQEWVAVYDVAQQRTIYPSSYSYHSECVFVPRRVVWAAMYKHFG